MKNNSFENFVVMLVFAFAMIGFVFVLVAASKWTMDFFYFPVKCVESKELGLFCKFPNGDFGAADITVRLPQNSL